jgi:undecaprenyl-diphosphatase
MPFLDNILNLPLPTFNHWGYWVIILAAALEATPLFGLFVPGQLIIIIGGFLVKLGVLDIGDAIFFAAFGAILGDLIGYFLGRKYGYSFLTKYGKYFLFKEKYLEKTKELMDRHAGKSLIIGRFNFLTRAFAPFVSGSSRTPFKKFFLYNIIGGISWATVFVFAGFIFGQSYEIASRYIGWFMFVAIILSIVFIYIYNFINKRKHIFSKYNLYALVLNIFSLYLFSKIIEDVVDSEKIIRLDAWINFHISSLWNPTLNKIMIFLTDIASPINLSIFSIFLILYLIIKKKWYYVLLWSFSIYGGLFFVWLIKHIMQRARPENFLITETGYGFPSGHTTLAVIFFSLFLYAFKDAIKNKFLKYLFIAINIILIISIGFSRVYLNVHWFSDVLAGYGLGIFWLTLLVLIFKTIIGLFHKFLEVIKKFIDKTFNNL